MNGQDNILTTNDNSYQQSKHSSSNLLCPTINRRMGLKVMHHQQSQHRKCDSLKSDALKLDTAKGCAEG